MKLGKIPEENDKRDAVHVAIAPVIAGEILYPGQKVYFSESGIVMGSRDHVPVGVVDTFRITKILKGERLWLMLFPETITSLRHDWTHPAFKEETELKIRPSGYAESMEWMENFAAGHRSGYEETNSYSAETLIQAGKDFIHHGQYHVQDGYTSLQSEEPTEFWNHFSVITGIDSSRQGTPFSCAC